LEDEPFTNNPSAQMLLSVARKDLANEDYANARTLLARALSFDQCNSQIRTMLTQVEIKLQELTLEREEALTRAQPVVANYIQEAKALIEAG